MAKRKSLRDSYLLMVGTAFGFAGLHRFYLGKPWTGFLWFITWGLGGIGTLYDFLTMKKQVDQVNQMVAIERRLDLDDDDDYGAERRYFTPASGKPRPEAKSLEHLMLILAEQNQGVLTAAKLALESGIPAQQAKDELEQMVVKGFASPGQRRSGLSVYVFQEFLTDIMRAELV